MAKNPLHPPAWLPAQTELGLLFSPVSSLVCADLLNIQLIIQCNV